jgi:hypothetical protein
MQKIPLLYLPEANPKIARVLFLTRKSEREISPVLNKGQTVVKGVCDKFAALFKVERYGARGRVKGGFY